MASDSLLGQWQTAATALGQSGDVFRALEICCRRAQRVRTHPCCQVGLNAKPTLPLRLIHRGVPSIGDGSRLLSFLEKLAARNATTTVVLGSSISEIRHAGCTDLLSSSLQPGAECFYGVGWARRFADWLNAVFPPRAGRHSLYSLGRTGSTAESFVDCWKTHLLPLGRPVDLFLFEFGVLGSSDSGSAEPLEALIRAALRMDGAPSLMQVCASRADAIGSRGSTRARASRRCRPGRASTRVKLHLPLLPQVNFFPFCRTPRACTSNLSLPVPRHLLRPFSALVASDGADAARAPGAKLAYWALPVPETVQAVGEFYSLPMVSVRHALLPELGRELRLSDWLHDGDRERERASNRRGCVALPSGPERAAPAIGTRARTNAHAQMRSHITHVPTSAPMAEAASAPSWAEDCAWLSATRAPAQRASTPPI